jgi:hypothetical protein
MKTSVLSPQANTDDLVPKMDRRRLQWTSLLPPVILLCAAAIVVAAFRVYPSDASCDRHRYPWSPALDMVEYRWETFENHQFSISTPYFGFTPTDQIENAWNELLPSRGLHTQKTVRHWTN